MFPCRSQYGIFVEASKSEKIMGIKGQTIKGFFWTGSGKLIEQGISWIISIALARLLSPGDYGLMAITSIFIYFINYFNEFSIGAAIIQKEKINESYLSSAFWFILVMSIMSYGFTYICAGFIASFFDQERLSDILKISGLSFIIMAIGVVPSSLLSRDLKFYINTKVSFLSNISMGIVSLALAYMGFGVWSLVIGSLVKSLSVSILAFYFCSWKPKLAVSFDEIYHLLRFGGPLTGAKSLHTVYYNADNFIVGKFLGEKLLGYYYMAFHLSTMPIDRLARIINEVNFPVLSKIQDRNDKIVKHFLQTSKYISIIMFPALIGLFLVSNDFVHVVLGKKWVPIIYPFQLFCFIGILRTINAIIPPLLTARGRNDLLLKYSITSAILLPVSFLIGVQFGINGVVYAWIIVYPFLTAYILMLTLKEINLPLAEYVKNLAPSIKASASMVIAVMLFQSIGINNRIMSFGGSILVGFASYMLSIAIFHKEILKETRGIIHSFKTRKVEG